MNSVPVGGLEFLVMARGNALSAKGRRWLTLRMAEILKLVDSRELIHGDINGKNLAWALSPAPVMYLIDCDGMVRKNHRRPKASKRWDGPIRV